jgi:hypothetical protein
MSPNEDRDGAERQWDHDRRGKCRFPLQRELRYKVLKDGTTKQAGNGETYNIGSGGVLFTLDRDLTPGALIQLSISWPVLLDGNCPVRLIVFGRVLRCSRGHCACTVDKYEFRTQARGPESTGPRRDNMLERWADTLRRYELKGRPAAF